MRTLTVTLSDVDREVYETFELRLAQHPSESLPYLWTRVLAYCLSYEDGIRFSKGGLSSAEEAPIAVWRGDGTLVAWIDVGAPSAERLHKASKAAERVMIYSSVNIAMLQKEAARRRVHKLEDVEVWLLPSAFVDALAEKTARTMQLEIVRTDNQVYASVDGTVIEAQLELARLI